MSESKEKSKNVEFSWLPFWAAGWMFSLGIGALDLASMAQLVWYKQVLGFFLTWILWPILLGLHYAG